MLGVYVEEAREDNNGVVVLNEEIGTIASPVSWFGMPALYHPCPPLRMETVPTQLGAMES